MFTKEVLPPVLLFMHIGALSGRQCERRQTWLAKQSCSGGSDTLLYYVFTHCLIQPFTLTCCSGSVMYGNIVGLLVALNVYRERGADGELWHKTNTLNIKTVFVADNFSFSCSTAR